MREKDIVLRSSRCAMSVSCRLQIVGPGQITGSDDWRPPAAASKALRNRTQLTRWSTWKANNLAALRNHKESDMNIVAATDLSTRSNRALRQAGLLARSPDAKLHLVHVVDEDQPAELVRIEEREAQRMLVEQIASMPELENVHCYPIVVKGYPFDGILQAAAAAHADLVVMGAHRKQFLRDIFTGTTIERVIRGGNIAPGEALGALVGVTFSCVSGN